jgi:hypothetical protein
MLGFFDQKTGPKEIFPSGLQRKLATCSVERITREFVEQLDLIGVIV